jgi:hypothetical protein
MSWRIAKDVSYVTEELGYRCEGVFILRLARGGPRCGAARPRGWSVRHLPKTEAEERRG